MDTAVVVGIITAVFAFIGIVLPVLVQFFMWRSANKGIIQIMLILSAVCCYIFWLTAYICQLNPLFGPQLTTEIIRVMQWEWGQ
ncbi:V-type proton ATPase subunit e 1-like [Gigantopelta aegis]|uniref:V-type proton ATPase subunit e 1-like n=1 Tax=Gigantopelta aegis TaxID=1735272 RepID=UPI001B88840E|nr:V-type proton ATPase subunit e 1-like [Gigantopelta aegis]